MRRWRGLAWTVLLLAAPAAASAQARTCNLVQEADFRQLINARGETIVYFRDPVRLRCTGGVSLAADSAVYNRTQLVMELIGSVVYRDSTRQLTSDWANYLGNLEQLLARGDVILTDLRNGSTATGAELQYLRASETRATSHSVLRGVRPRAVLQQAEPAPGDTAAPLEVVADRLEFIGDTLFLARGSVDLVRGATTGAADSARYHQANERLTLLGDAQVQDDRFRLEGQRIDALVDGEVLREVLAVRETSLISEDLTIHSERLHIGFVDGALDRLQAWNPPAPPSAPAPSERATALAEGFRLRADSIDARADSGALREVRAVGRGYGERRVDTATVQLPSMIARDWIQGDTIIGYFTTLEPAADTVATATELGVRPDAVPDTAAGAVAAGSAATADSAEVVLERVVVIGGSSPALSLYRMEPEGEGEQGAINFMKATRIILFMTEGEVARVEADGPVDGLYLDPVARRPEPADGGGS